MTRRSVLLLAGLFLLTALVGYLIPIPDAPAAQAAGPLTGTPIPPSAASSALGMALAPTPSPTTVTFSAYADSYVDEGMPSSNYGASTSLYVSLDEFGYERRSFAKFNLSSIPAGSTIVDATFRAYLTFGSGLSTVSVTMCRAASSWTEGGITWNNKPSCPSVNSTTVSTAVGWRQWDATSLVQGWLSGTYNNYGLGLFGPGSGSQYARIFSSRTGGNAPQLVVRYYPPTPTPTSTHTPTHTPTPTATATQPPINCVFPLTVNTTHDTDDGYCDVPGCSLREAIQCANAHAGPDVISFNIPDTAPGFTGVVWVISPGTALPGLTDNGTTIDGASQTVNRGDTNPVGPEVVVNGSRAGAANGFFISGANCVIRGLNIGGFELSGIYLSGGGAHDNVIEGNYIGVAADGSAALGNLDGITLRNGPSNNTIGRDNVIGGNRNYGISLGVASGNTILDNRIGTNPAGDAAMPNGLNGVDVAVSNGTLIQDNVISGNGSSGLQISQSSGVRLTGNFIGLNQAGSAAVPNAHEGLFVENGSSDVTIGGSTEAERNVISGNGGNGIGIKDPETGNVTILGNFIGTDATGANPIPNGQNGVYIFDGAHANTVGPGNVIAYNGGDGVRVDGPDRPALHNTITQNSITQNDGKGIENIHGGNTELPPPVITGFGSVEGTACPECTVEVFSDIDGEGALYEGTTTADAAGNWTWPGTPHGPFVTATNTDADGNTSEFSLTAVEFIVTDMSVDKRVAEPLSGIIGVGGEVTFHIVIRNTGTVTLTRISLHDFYNPACLEFVEATPAPDTVDPFRGELIWDDLTDDFGDLAPEEELTVSVTLRGVDACGLTLNVAQGQAWDDYDEYAADRDEENVEVTPGPPELEVNKVVRDPVVCVGDEVLFGLVAANVGEAPIETLRSTDLYDTTYLQSLNPPAWWGPDDGELTRFYDFIADFGSPLAPDWFLFDELWFLARAETPSTVDEFRAMFHEDPTTERSATRAVTILPEPGTCQGNLVVNGGFEAGWAGWVRGFGDPRIGTEAHEGARSLLLGILPDEPDAARYDIAFQDVAIPADAREAWLTFWVNVDNEDPDIRANQFVASVVTMDGAAHGIVHTVSSHGWRPVGYNLTPYIGETVRLFFGAANDGGGAGNLWAYVDEVTICISRCGPVEPPPTWTPGMCWKASWDDYAPHGLPDFDQRGYVTGPITATADGPLAALNSLWWFDSKYEPGSTPPPAISDGYDLLEAQGDWDDHDAQNVQPLYEDLRDRFHTDGAPGHVGDWLGTRPDDLANGIRTLLDEKDLLDEYAVTLMDNPTYDLVREEVLQSHDVLLLLGFWEHQPEGWRRFGGHWVTVAGVDCTGGRRIGLSDPFADSAEAGYDGVYLPTADHDPDHDPRLHDDAAFVSHDIYPVSPRTDALDLVDYVRLNPTDGTFFPDVLRFLGANTPTEFGAVQAEGYEGGPGRVWAEYAVIVSPLPETVNLFFNPRFTTAEVGDIVPLDIVATAARTQPFDTVQVYVDFDPTTFQVVDEAGNPITQLTPGTPTLVLQNEVDNEAGEVNYAARTPLGEPPLWDRVTVARIYLRVLRSTPAEGAPVEFSWVTPRRTDVLAGATSVLGRVWEARIQAGEPATVYGRVALLGRPDPPNPQWAIPLTVELQDPATDTTLEVFGVTTDQQGRFTLEGLGPGTYDFRVKGMHTLANRWSNLILGTGDNVVDMTTLHEGDVDNDNDVDGTDASLLNLAFGSTPGAANWDPRADLNEDHLVDGVDMGLLAVYFGEVGDVEVGTLAATAQAPLAISNEVSPVRATVGSSQPVTIAFSPEAFHVNVGDTFTVTVTLESGAQPFDTADVHLLFPPGVLQAVDASGLPASAVEPSGVFDLDLINEVENGEGRAHYAATMLGRSASGRYSVFRVRFKALQPAAQEWLRFGVWPPMQTTVTYLGDPVLTAWPAASVTISGETRHWLPLLLKGS